MCPLRLIQDTTPARSLRSPRRGVRRRGPGVFANALRVPLSGSRVETTGPPTFLGNPHCACALLSDPGGADASGRYDASTRPPYGPRRRLPHATCLSGLNHTAWTLAVYASQCRSPGHHARLASGCRASSTGRDCLPAGFHREVSELRPTSSHPPFPSFRGTRCMTVRRLDARTLSQPERLT